MTDHNLTTAPVDPEVMPSTDLAGLAETIGELNRARALDLPELRQAAERWTITTKQNYLNASEDLLKIRKNSKLAEHYIRPYLDKVNEVRTYLLNIIKKHELAAGEADKILAGKMAEFNRLEEAVAKREQDRINEENRRKAQELADKQKKADEEAARERKEKRVIEIRGMLRRKEISKTMAAKLLKEAGANEEADKVQAALDAEKVAANPPKVTVQPDTVTVAGIAKRTQWTFKVIDIEKIPRALLYPNRGQNGEWKPEDFPRLGKMVRESKSKMLAEAEAGGGIVVTDVPKV